MHEPTLTKSPAGDTPRGLVLMLHGGADRGTAPVDDRSLSWRRARWMMHEIQGRLHNEGLDVWLLRYRLKGWNLGHSELPSPVPDARWALDEVRRAHGSLPVVLLGHSMGGRTAVAVADDPSVTGVVALAPWLPKNEPIRPLAGKHLLAAHGTHDRITRFKDTRYYVLRARRRRCLGVPDRDAWPGPLHAARPPPVERLRDQQCRSFAANLDETQFVSSGGRMVPRTAAAESTRPRVEGEREAEILDAAVEILIEHGYDRLTMDAVALRAKASKATLYRRWTSKQTLVVDAVIRSKKSVDPAEVDTGSLRGDLIGTFCGHGGITERDSTLLLAAVITALHTDAEFAARVP